MHSPPFSFTSFALWCLSSLLVSSLRLMNFPIPPHLTSGDPGLRCVGCNWGHHCPLVLLPPRGYEGQLVLSPIMSPSNSKLQFSLVLQAIWSSCTSESQGKICSDVKSSSRSSWAVLSSMFSCLWTRTPVLCSPGSLTQEAEPLSGPHLLVH